MEQIHYVKDAISKVVSGNDLSEEEALLVMDELISGRATENEIAALLVALRMKGETVEEITGFANKLREKAIKIKPEISRTNFVGRLTDTCGTGGDELKTLNISTLSAFVVAGCGVPVAKHGNRSFTGKCGSADLLEKLGVNILASPEDVKRSIETCGIGFMFAANFHPAMKYVQNVRKEIRIRTVFNILGPLVNPANTEAQLVGVYDRKLVKIIPYVLKKLGLKSAMVVHGIGGLDEISIIGPTEAAWLHEDGSVEENITISPLSFGLKQRRRDEITLSKEKKIEDYALEALKILIPPADPISPTAGGADRKIRRNDFRDEEALLDMVIANSSAALVVSGKVNDFIDGVDEARRSIESGRAFRKLLDLIKCSKGNPSFVESSTTILRSKSLL